MKKNIIFLFVFITLMSMNVFSASLNTAYDPSAGLVTIPKVEVGGVVVYENVVLIFDADGRLSIVSADEADSGSTTVSGGRVYPYQDTIEFIGQSVDGIFFLSDGSMWTITGRPNRLASAGNGSKNFTIYEASDSIADPDSGTRSDYFMLIEGNPATFFVNPL